MWSFTDCLVMVGGCVTVTGHTVGGQSCRDLPGSRLGEWLQEPRGKQASRCGKDPILET